MKKFLTGSIALALLSVAAADAGAQQRNPPFGPRITLPSHTSPFGGEFHGGHFKRGHVKHGHFPTFILVEREAPVIIEREVVVREVPAAAPPPPPPPPRKPYVIGNSYASLPSGCMKMIEGGVSYYYCGGGEWYRQVGKQYRAVERP